MKTGNVTGNVYKRSVHRKIETNGIGVKGAEYGEGCAFLTSENVDKAPEKAKQLWITAQSLSVWSGAEGAKLCVYEAVNRAAAAAVGTGEAKVRMVSMQLMLPADCQEQELQKMTVAAQEAAQKLQVTLADVKVHVSCAVIAPVATAEALAEVWTAPAGAALSARAGQQIVMGGTGRNCPPGKNIPGSPFEALSCAASGRRSTAGAALFDFTRGCSRR